MEQHLRTRNNPYRQAWREGGVILVVAIAAAAVYMSSAADAPRLIFKPRPPTDTAGAAALSPDSSAPTTPTGMDTVAGSLSMPDSSSIPSTIDTSLESGEKERILAQQQKSRDSLRAIAQARADSARNASTTNTRTTPPQEDQSVFLARVAELKAIDTETAWKVFELKGAVFIDARPENQFDEGHIPGALNMYANAFSQYVPQVVQIPRDKQIVVYCGGGDCDLSHELADQIRALGLHKKVAVYTGGTAEWKQKNYPLSR